MGKGINFQPLLCTFTKNAVLWRKQILGKDILLLLLRKTKVLILQLNNRVLQEKALYKCFIEEFTGHDLCHYILNGLRIHKCYTLLVLVNIVHKLDHGIMALQQKGNWSFICSTTFQVLSVKTSQYTEKWSIQYTFH